MPEDASELELVGICSGSWYAAHAARNIGAQSAILVNLLRVELARHPDLAVAVGLSEEIR